jgi:hypothetical protein
LKVRELYVPGNLPTDDPDVDLQIEHVYARLCELEPREPLKTPEDERVVEEIVEKAKKDPEIRMILSIFFAVDATVSKKQFDDSRSVKRLDVAKTYSQGAKHLSNWELLKVGADMSTRKRKIVSSIADQKGIKFEVDATHIGPTVTLLSASLIAGGYLYVDGFYGRFGIRVSNFFSVSDYLGASMDISSTALMSAAMALVGVAYGFLHGSRLSKRHLEANISQLIPLHGFIVATLVASASVSFFINKFAFFQILPLVTWVIVLYFVPQWSISYFKHPMFAVFVLLFLAHFAGQIISRVHLDALAVQNGTYWKTHTEQLRFASGSPYSGIDVQLLGANSGFYFCYDAKSKIAFAIPRDKVMSVEYRLASELGMTEPSK